MKTVTTSLFSLFSLWVLCAITSCDEPQEIKPLNSFVKEPAYTNASSSGFFSYGDTLKKKTKSEPCPVLVGSPAYNNTKGFFENGDIIRDFDCPDSRFFPPVDINDWHKVPVVTGRLPRYAETMNGTAIAHYGEKANDKVKPYNMSLPRLAYYNNPQTGKETLVIVIQVTQTATDTVVGYRYLTGGCGGSAFYRFHFLTKEEVKKVPEWWALHGASGYFENAN